MTKGAPINHAPPLEGAAFRAAPFFKGYSVPASTVRGMAANW